MTRMIPLALATALLAAPAAAGDTRPGVAACKPTVAPVSWLARMSIGPRGLHREHLGRGRARWRSRQPRGPG